MNWKYWWNLFFILSLKSHILPFCVHWMCFTDDRLISWDASGHWPETLGESILSRLFFFYYKTILQSFTVVIFFFVSSVFLPASFKPQSSLPASGSVGYGDVRPVAVTQLWIKSCHGHITAFVLLVCYVRSAASLSERPAFQWRAGIEGNRGTTSPS